MENFETTDILVTDIYHKPKENHFNQTVSMHLKDLEYNPKKERKKYSYNNVLKVRKNKHEKEK